VFDNNPSKIGQTLAGFVISDSARVVELVRREGIRVAMLAVPAAQAQPATLHLIEAGVQAILNYAPTTLIVPRGVYVQNIDPAVHLQRMTYYLEPPGPR
jgi:redox-sensing transcriptional repressor